jgi:hypothetical protein
MKWFQNIPAGQPFTPGQPSGDYSLQLMMGYNNYLAWRNENASSAMQRVKMIVPYSQARKEAAVIEAKRAPLRADDGKKR